MKDQLHRTIQINYIPKRIVSLVPSQTELLYDLGLESSIVGITKFCVHPHHLLTNVAVVGGTKQVHYDKIKALKPDIILCNKEENTQEMIQELELIAPVHISDINSVDDCLELINSYGQLFLILQEAKVMISKIKEAQSDFEIFVASQPIHSVAYFIWKDPWMVAGRETFIDYILSLNGFKNVFNNQTRYPEISFGKTYPEVKYVLLSSEPFPFKEEHFKTIQPYFPNAKIVLVDGEMFSWYGSRLLKAFDYFKRLHLQEIV
jgi:ABC-type Fe3+-hydroxamate transport system substrate-binding protein